MDSFEKEAANLLKEGLSLSEGGRELMRDLPFLLTTIKSDDSAETLFVNAKGELHIGPKFWEKHIRHNRAAAVFVLLHELLHLALGDPNVMLRESEKEESNIKHTLGIAMDMRINPWALELLGELRSSGRRWLKKFYRSGTGLILAPSDSRLVLRQVSYRTYRAFTNVWGGYWSRSDDVTTLARELLNDAGKGLQLLGNHSGYAAGDRKVPGKILKAANRAIGKMAKSALKAAGYSTALMNLCREVERIGSTFNTRFYRAFAARNMVDRLRFQLGIRETRTSDIIPIRPRRSSISMLAAGHVPVIWKNIRDTHFTSNGTVNVYLDVSGSMEALIPKMLGLAAGLKVTNLYVFSNIVVKTTPQKLKTGEYESTGGTDFSCIIRHMLDNRIRKAVMITDGYAGIAAGLLDQLAEKGYQLFPIYVGDMPTSVIKDIAEKLGTEVYKLDDLVG